jgi:broad specificity phosphatase PhoE
MARICRRFGTGNGKVLDEDAISPAALAFGRNTGVNHGNIALFSHGHSGRVLAARWIKLSVMQAQHLLLATASLSVLCFEHDRTDQPAIAQWNSYAGIDG